FGLRRSTKPAAKARGGSGLEPTTDEQGTRRGPQRVRRRGFWVFASLAEQPVDLGRDLLLVARLEAGVDLAHEALGVDDERGRHRRDVVGARHLAVGIEEHAERADLERAEELLGVAALLVDADREDDDRLLRVGVAPGERVERRQLLPARRAP